MKRWLKKKRAFQEEMTRFSGWEIYSMKMIGRKSQLKQKNKLMSNKMKLRWIFVAINNKTAQ